MKIRFQINAMNDAVERYSNLPVDKKLIAATISDPTKKDCVEMFTYFFHNFEEGVVALSESKNEFAGSHRVIRARIYTKDTEAPIWKYGCWPGELTVSSIDGVLVLPSNLTNKYVKKLTDDGASHHLILSEEEYDSLHDVSTTNPEEQYDKPFWVPREKLKTEQPVMSLEESPLVARLCGGTNQAKQYAKCLADQGIKIIRQDFFSGFPLTELEYDYDEAGFPTSEEIEISGKNCVKAIWLGGHEESYVFDAQDCNLTYCMSYARITLGILCGVQYLGVEQAELESFHRGGLECLLKSAKAGDVQCKDRKYVLIDPTLVINQKDLEILLKISNVNEIKVEGKLYWQIDKELLSKIESKRIKSQK